MFVLLLPFVFIRSHGHSIAVAENGASPDIPAPEEGEGEADYSRGHPSKMTQEEWIEQTTIGGQGGRLPPGPPPLGFEVNNDLSNLKSALEEDEESRSKPSRVIIDDELFDLEFTPDMTQIGRDAIIRERFAIAVSNNKMIEKMVTELEAEAKQAIWQLTVLQPKLHAANEKMQRFIDEFSALTGRRGRSLIRRAISEGETLVKDAWKSDWDEEWIFTQGDQEEEVRMKETAKARTARVQASPSPLGPFPQR